LDHAVKLQAEQAYQEIIIAMTPHLPKAERKKILDSYSRIIDGDEQVSGAIINSDRERLKKLLNKTKWQKKVQK